MMWFYVQSSGDLFLDGVYIETGYSGANPEGKNKPDKECSKNVGPIPRGYYSIKAEQGTPSPVALPLLADDPNYCSPARSGFLIHGDNATGTASTGCIILSRKTREKIRDSGDIRLRVVRDSVKIHGIKNRSFSKPQDL
jgi:Protein of unknown function (DUF2778)